MFRLGRLLCEALMPNVVNDICGWMLFINTCDHQTIHIANDLFLHSCLLNRFVVGSINSNRERKTIFDFRFYCISCAVILFGLQPFSAMMMFASLKVIRCGKWQRLLIDERWWDESLNDHNSSGSSEMVFPFPARNRIKWKEKKRWIGSNWKRHFRFSDFSPAPLISVGIEGSD